VLEQIVAERGRPLAIRGDNGSELTGRHFLAWCVERQIELVHIQPGKPTQNAHVESFHSRLREFFSRTRKKFKSLSFSVRKRTSKYTCAGGLNRLRKIAQEQIPRGKKRSSFGSPVWPMTLIVSLQPEFRVSRLD